MMKDEFQFEFLTKKIEFRTEVVAFHWLHVLLLLPFYYYQWLRHFYEGTSSEKSILSHPAAPYQSHADWKHRALAGCDFSM